MIYYDKFILIKEIHTLLIKKNKAINNRNIKTMLYKHNHVQLQKKKYALNCVIVFKSRISIITRFLRSLSIDFYTQKTK